jgi:hypothetical protein
MKRFCALFCCLLAACGAADAGSTQVAAEPGAGQQPPVALPGPPLDRFAVGQNVFEGKVTGHPLDVKETVFLLGEFDLGVMTPVLVMVQTDTPGICAHLQHGTLPKNATLFPVALIQQDGEAVAAPRSYRPPNPENPAETANYFTVAQFRKLDGQCGITPAPEVGVGKVGQVILQTLEPGVRATGEYGLLIGDQEDIVRGTFDATFCDAPELYENLESLLNPNVDAEHCL